MKKSNIPFVGLHAHSVAGSPFDALGYPQDHMDYAYENGCEALALTDQIRQAELHNNLRIQRDQLLGASIHGRLRPEAHSRPRELMAIFLRSKA